MKRFLFIAALALSLAAVAQDTTQTAGAAQLAQQGMAALQAKPADVSDADWAKVQPGLTAIFQGAIGQQEVAQKNYPAAQQALQSAVEAEPNNLLNVFPLAQAYLIPSIS